ncbi:F-box protein At2g35280-like [Abrus precatorius]|uniref:F-box protein At2g35280-like n=1 Tax=Abrus precatorius TaxID=3816 RepID=A0A8B8KNG3_ABRPR|nr:F-box protein At2g35280-like [Abrus precatorius]
MTASRLMKKTNDKRRRTFNNRSSPTATIKSLPKDMLVEVVARVASHSITDLHNMKMCCADFLDAADDNHVWRHVSLDKLPLIQWFPNDKALSFLKRCRESGNTESLYREGLQEYFSYPKGNIRGLESLKMAAEKGHTDAKYMYGMILLCSEDNELRTQGLEHMRFLRKSKCIIRCRKNVVQTAKFRWKNNGTLACKPTPLCHDKNTCKGWSVKKGQWLLLNDDDDDIELCEYCRWDHEIEFFLSVI